MYAGRNINRIRGYVFLYAVGAIPPKWPMSNPSLAAETDMKIRQTRTLQSSQVTSAALSITPEAIEAAKIVLCKLAQQHEFSSEIQLLKKGQMIRKQSPLRRLNPFLDKDGLLRVGGRLKLQAITIPVTTV